MRIAVNTRFLLKDYLEGYGYFIYELFRRITENHPEHTFIFIFDRPWDQQFIFGKNVIPIQAGPPARHPLLWKYWYDYKVPALLRKHKADLFISCDGFCSLRTRVPQCLVLHDLAFLHYPAGISKTQLAFYKKYTPAFLKKANTVITVSAFSKNDIAIHYPFATDKLQVIYNGIRPVFQPLDFAARQPVKDQYTEGKEYFIYTGSVHPRKNLLGLLRAFSLFKKRQQSSMKLVIAGRLAWKYDSFVSSLKTYKYRQDVVMTGYLPDTELARLMAAAYALVYPSFFEGFGVPVAEAMQAGVPVITSAGTAMEEVAGEAALYADPADHKALADQLMRMYKDESLRAGLIEKGKIKAKQYNWDTAAGRTWELIQDCVA
ncbi:MAG: glycosyltransferase family 4 protein [Chitinophagales bacterium]|nr:glycosyltransferase family 4 protein [Chitinophagales bacterium]